MGVVTEPEEIARARDVPHGVTDDHGRGASREWWSALGSMVKEDYMKIGFIGLGNMGQRYGRFASEGG